MHHHNVPEFVQLLKERKYPVDGMRMEVIDHSDGCAENTKGIITMLDEDKFELTWCRRHCLLAMIAQLQWRRLFGYFLPYCFGFFGMQPFEVESDRGRTLQVVMVIK